MPSKCKCPRCGTPLVLKGGRKSEAKAKEKLLLTMQVSEPTSAQNAAINTKAAQ